MLRNIILFFTAFSSAEKPTWEDTVPFIPPIQSGFVIKVYDGDTLTIAAKMPYKDSPMYRFPVRLNRIDCPEMKSSNKNEVKCAHIAKDTLSKLVLNKAVTLKNVQLEKYGRILADVYIGNVCVNDYMVQRKLAVRYDGGAKNSPSNWLDYYASRSK